MRGKVLAAAVVVAMVAMSGGSAGAKTKAPSTRAQTAFLNELATTFLNSVDYSAVQDRDVVAAGVAFCRQLAKIKGRLDGVDFYDAVQTITTRFTGSVSMRPDGTPRANGALLLAYGVGFAAVHRFCPKQRPAFL